MLFSLIINNIKILHSTHKH